ncbi:hypothetical protein PybrP1_007669 [[Pythium] brassicae (nom. inval.)]|nr:hypothetical protein PybrP1_007669 [[Pythium] brassicae (nom. inval.)]
MGRSRSRSVSRTAASSSSGSRRRRDDASPSRGGGGSSSRRSRRSPSRSRSRSRGRRHRDAPSSSTSAATSTVAVTAAAEPPVRAATVEKNGEISMSIEETNRVRAALGLKPLSLGPKAASSVVSVQKSAAELDAERARAQLQKQLAQSKTRRALTHKLDGASLGEQLKAAAASSALDWVKQSRAVMESETATAQQQQTTTTMLRQDAYDASALAGMVVGHDLKAFEGGDEVVLTLKDTRVLAGDGNDLNDEQDELVNVEMSERDRRAAEKQRAARAFMPAYTGYDDDEFIAVGGRLKKPAARLLAQYDDERDRDARQQAQKFTLDSSGNTRTAGDSAGDSHAADDDDAVVSLAMDKTKRIDEFFTQDEVDAQFAKRKGKKLRRKKKLQRAAHDAQESGGGGDSDDAASLVRRLEAEALKHASNDRGRRRRRVTDDDDDDDDDNGDSKLSGVEEASLLRFQEARERANATASSALSAMKKRRRVAALDDADVLDDAMDLELSASLARTRRLAQLKSVSSSQVTAPGDDEKPTPLTSEDRITALVSQTIGAEPAGTNDAASTTTTTTTTTTAPAVVGHVFGVSAQEQAASENTVVFNDATDFESRLRNAMEQRSAQFQAAAAANAGRAAGRQVAALSGTQSIASSSASGVASRAAVATTTAADGDEEMKSGGSDSDDDRETKGDGEVWGEEQPLVGAGMAATLALLRKTGDLRETRVERQTGRANDQRERDVNDALRVKDGVKLDYRDEFGRLLTKKEAFRVLSYKFHGHEPGKKKKEKRIKQLKEELAAQKLLSGEGSSKMMKVLEKKQKVSQQAHVVLSGGV